MADERDDTTLALVRLERPAAPDPEFTDALLELLLAELGEAPQEARRRFRLPVLLRPRLLAATAAGLAAVAVAIGLVLALRVTEESALAAVRDAQRHAVEVPPFRALVSQRLAGELALGTVVAAAGDDWLSVTELSYAGRTRWNRLVVHDSLASTARLVVWDGEVLGIHRPDQDRFYLYPRASARTRRAAGQLSPLATLSPRFRLFPIAPATAPEAYFRESCRVGTSQEIAGRAARRITCDDGDFRFSVWLDRVSGLLLKLETPGSLFEVRRIEFDVRFAPEDFGTEPPAGATAVRVGESG